MRPRKAEREAVVRLLDREHDDVDSLAGDVLQLAWSHLLQREWFAVVFHQPRVWTTVHGPFESRNVAEKFITNHLVASSHGAHASVVRLAEGNVALEFSE